MAAERRAAWEQRVREEAEAHARMLDADRAAASAWAAGVLADPDMVTLDTETTGLYDAWIVEVAVLAADGRVLLDTLVNPQVPIPDEVTLIHGITDEDVRDAPGFPQILPGLARALHGKRVVIYNQAFDTGILRNELDRHYRAIEPEAAPESWLTHPSADAWLSGLRAECAMKQYARWYGEWSDYWGDYRWQRLQGGHRARGDCEATIGRLKTMAAGIPPYAMAARA